MKARTRAQMDKLDQVKEQRNIELAELDVRLSLYMFICTLNGANDLI